MENIKKADLKSSNWKWEEMAGNEEYLSNTQRKIIQLIIEGKTNKEIAVLLGLSPLTVKSYISVIFRKFNLKNRVGLIYFVLKGGIESLDVDGNK